MHFVCVCGGYTGMILRGQIQGVCRHLEQHPTRFRVVKQYNSRLITIRYCLTRTTSDSEEGLTSHAEDDQATV
jgi:hypothetical protein